MPGKGFFLGMDREETDSCDFVCGFTADTPFSQVKVGEVTSWLARREKSPKALVGAFSRAWWRWNHKYVQPKRSGVAPFFQVVTASMIFFYAINYGKLSEFFFHTEKYFLLNIFHKRNANIYIFFCFRATSQLQASLNG